MQLRHWLYALIAYLTVGVASTFILFLTPGIIGHNWDWSVPWNPQAAVGLAHAALSTWWSAELGFPNIGMSNAPYFFLAGLFAGHPWLFSRLLLIFGPTMGALAGMFLASRVGSVLSLSSPLGWWIGGLFFGFSPFFFNELSAGAPTQVFAHSAFALSAGFFVWYREKRRFLLLASACFCSLFIALSMTDWILFFFVALVILWDVDKQTYAAFVAMTVAFNAYWLLPFVNSALTVLRNNGFQAAPDNLVFRVPLLWQLFTFSGYPFSFFDNARPIWSWSAGIATLVLVFVAFAAIALARLSLPLARYYVLLFVGIAVAAVGAGPLGLVMIWAYGHVPGFAFFRSPQHLIVIQMLGACVIVGVGCALVMTRDSSRLVAVMLLFLALVGRAPYLTGDYSSRYLSGNYPGNAIETFEPSPGNVHAINEIERSAPAYARPLFIPLTFTPLYLQTPYQPVGQGGDPDSIELAHMRGTVLDMTQMLSRFGASLESQLVDRMPEVLDSGLPAILDVSHAVIHYDRIANFQPFQLNRYLAYNVAHFLDDHAGLWKRTASDDFVDLYQRSDALPHIFLGDAPTEIAGDIDDVADVELPHRVLTAALSGTVPSHASKSLGYAFEPIWDWIVDLKAGEQSLVPAAQFMKLKAPREGDYAIVLKREPGISFSGVQISPDIIEHEDERALKSGTDVVGIQTSVDGFPLDNVVQWASVITAESAGARWVKLCTLHLSAGTHTFSFAKPPLGITAAALILSGDLPPIPDYAYQDASMIGIRAPDSGEGISRLFHLDRTSRVRIFGLGYQGLSNRGLPIESIVPAAKDAEPRFPFFYPDDTRQSQYTYVPSYWYMQAPQPRIFPLASLLPAFQTIDYAIDTAGLRGVVFHTAATALNRQRTIELSSGGQSVIKLLPVSVTRPSDSLDSAVTMSERLTDISIATQAKEDHANVLLTFSPAVNAFGKDRGLPVGEIGGTWLELGNAGIDLRLPHTAGGGSAAVFGSSIRPIPVHNAQHVIIALRSAVRDSRAISSQANAYLRCGKTVRAYVVPALYKMGNAHSYADLHPEVLRNNNDLSTQALPATYEAGDAQEVVDINLELLRSNADSRFCNVIGFAVRLTTSNTAGFPVFTVLGADVFVRNTWLDEGIPVSLDAVREEQAAYRLRGERKARYVSLKFPLGDLPDFYVTQTGVPLGEAFQFQHWAREPDQLAGYTVYSTHAAELPLSHNHGRGVLRIGKRNVLYKDYAEEGTDPYWFESKSTLYVAWPSTNHEFGYGKFYVIPDQWFTAEQGHEGALLDLASVPTRSSDIVIHVLSPNPEPPIVCYVNLSSTPRLNYRVKVDGDMLKFSVDRDAEWSYVQTGSVTRTLQSGLHSLSFPEDANLERVFVEHVQADAPEHVTPVTDLRSTAPYEWTFTIPQRSRATTLAFLESFNANWELHGVPGAEHFVVDGYANGWVLPPGPAVGITLYYGGQKFLIAGCVISLAAFLIILCVVYSVPAMRRLRKAMV